MSDDIKKKLWGDTPQKQLHPILENDLADLLDRISISFHDTNLNGCNFNPEALTVLADYAKHLLEKENAAEVVAYLMASYQVLHSEGRRSKQLFVKEMTSSRGLAKELIPLIEQRRKAGISSGDERREVAKRGWDEWQKAADEVWKRHPGHSATAVAKIIAQQFPDGKLDTIRKKIKKPS